MHIEVQLPLEGAHSARALQVLDLCATLLVDVARTMPNTFEADALEDIGQILDAHTAELRQAVELAERYPYDDGDLAA